MSPYNDKRGGNVIARHLAQYNTYTHTQILEDRGRRSKTLKRVKAWFSLFFIGLERKNIAKVYKLLQLIIPLIPVYVSLPFLCIHQFTFEECV